MKNQNFGFITLFASFFTAAIALVLTMQFSADEIPHWVIVSLWIACAFFGALTLTFLARHFILPKELPKDPTGHSINNASLVNSTVAMGDNNTINQNHPRKLTPSMGAELINKLPKGKPIDITILLNDAEAENFAAQVFFFLKDNGFTFSHNETFTQSSSVRGGGGRIGVIHEENETSLIFGGKDASDTDFQFAGGGFVSRGLTFGPKTKF